MTKLVTKADQPWQRLVYGEVYAPDRPDAQGEFMRADQIQKMAHKFARDLRLNQIDVMHDNQVVDANCIVESFIARKGDPDFIEGAWVIGMHIPDDELWNKILKGEINGFSMEALVTRHPQEVQLDLPPVVTGMTSKSEEHEHKFYVSYKDDGSFRGGTTDFVNGHQHKILAGTHTEDAAGHSHRFSSVDVLRIV
jgi:hypothetical protein